MASDDEIVEWARELGMRVEKVAGGSFFQVNVASPLGGPSVAVIRPRAEDKYYIFTIVIDIDKEVSQEVVRNMAKDLMRMNVEFFLTPEDKPRKLHIAKLKFAEGLTRNEFLEALTLVKNAAYLAVTWLQQG